MGSNRSILSIFPEEPLMDEILDIWCLKGLNRKQFIVISKGMKIWKLNRMNWKSF